MPRYARACLLFVAVWWIAWGIAPNYRTVWLMESLLVIAAVPVIAFVERRVGLSRPAHAMLAGFLALHIVGSHYSYQEAPPGDWAREWFGYSRNHYDRLVHFLFGLLVALPVAELLARGVRTARGHACWLSLSVIMAASLFYELLEWWFMLGMDPDAGMAFLGAQGDFWDAQKDSALASLGAVLTLGAAYVCGRPQDSMSPSR